MINIRADLVAHVTDNSTTRAGTRPFDRVIRKGSYIVGSVLAHFCADCCQILKSEDVQNRSGRVSSI